MKIREITEYVSKYIHPDIDKQLQKIADATEKLKELQNFKL